MFAQSSFASTAQIIEAIVDLSVVIPAYGGEAQLRRCLEAIVREREAGRTPEAFEVVVADDATPGGLDPKLKSDFPDCQWLCYEQNLGFSGNTNRGFFASKGRIVCLLNTDMYVEPGYFKDCLKVFDEDAKLFAVVGQINEPNGNNDGYKQLELQLDKAILRTVRSDHQLSRKPASVPYANGGGSFFRRSIFEELGGFDSIFAPYYWEDTDLGYRAWKRGYHIQYDPKRCLFHDHQATIGQQKRRKVRRIFKRNRRYFVWRNFTSEPLPRLVWHSTLRPAIKALFKLRFAKAWELLSELWCLRQISEARRQAFRLDRRSDLEVAKLCDQSPLTAEAIVDSRQLAGDLQQESGEH